MNCVLVRGKLPEDYGEVLENRNVAWIKKGENMDKYCKMQRLAN